MKRTRRAFLGMTSGAGLVAAVGWAGDGGQTPLPRRLLGKTGVEVPVLGLGTAPVGQRTRDEAIRFFHECIDAGVTYLDTAPEFAGYYKAQEYLGPVLKERREEVFVVTKCWKADGEEALALLKQNLKELQIEQADLVYAHSIGADNMAPEKIHAADGVCRALDKAKRDGLTRFVGVSGHNRPGWFLEAMERWDYDVMMNAVSLVSRHIYDFEGRVWPKAREKGIGLAAMKVFGGAKGQEAKGARMPDELRPQALRYALNLPGVSVVVVGMHDREELEENLAIVRAAKPLDGAELAELEPRTRELARAWGEVYGVVG
ncbi:MAG: oxidoreductase [Isosphaeraceae bacterium]|jgi:aryl-alcohol dehydrogenase-like predicted oxidoreductase|nr:MAG: oxidoreductase [Isosphaeraceae bacterium]